MSLEVKQLTKSFGSNVAIDHLSLSMDAPGIYGLIGTNGAGKTTTIRCILGIMEPDEGTALWNGKRISRETLKFGYLPEERGIYMKTKVLEQLVYFGMLRGMNRTDARNSALSYLKRLKIADYKNTPAEKLSKGNQQKIQLIAALIHHPTLIFLDEPFSGLDPLNAEILRSLLAELVEEGCYIVMSSHQMSTVEEFCRDLVILTKGHTVLQGNLKAIKAGYGHTNLVLSTAEDVDTLAAKHGLTLLNQGAQESEYKITGDSMAQEFLTELLNRKIFPTKYEIKEPSLQEIFVEKVGAAQ